MTSRAVITSDRVRELKSLLHEVDLVESALPLLTTREKKELLNAMEQALIVDGWPIAYINSERQHIYTPHHELEKISMESDLPSNLLVKGGEGSGKSVFGIIKDLERIRRGMSGLMACVGAETMVDGVPIGDRHSAFVASTLFGPALATPGFVEEKADLFRIQLSTGDQVLATRNHRFLTPIGFRPLNDLRVGSLVAVDGRTCDPCLLGKSSSSRGDYSEGFHQCGGYATRGGQHVQGRWQQLALSVLEYALYADLLSRAYIEGSSPPAYLAFCRAVQSLAHATFGIESFEKHGTYAELPLGAYNSDNPESWRPRPDPPCQGNACPMPSDHWHVKPDSRLPYSSQFHQQFLVADFQHRTSQLSSRSVFYSYPHYTTQVQWVSIAKITFSHYGEAYGLSVPGIGHYRAGSAIAGNSPNLPHFQRSLWKEFQNWCPWDYVIPSHRRRGNRSWLPVKPFDIVFENGTYLHCVGAKDIRSLEGPNLSFAHFDEARLFSDANAIKVITGRIRIPGPHGEPPQMWMTTTPKMNWLHDFFGPLKLRCPTHGQVKAAIQEGLPEVCPVCGARCTVEDIYADFKRDSKVITLRLRDNAHNLSDGFVSTRAKSLTENEKAVLIDAEWIDDESDESFLPSMTLWDSCRIEMPPMTVYDPLVIGLDASEMHDTFSLCAVGRSPIDPDNSVAVRYFEIWDPGGKLLDYRGTEDYPGPELRLLWLFENYDVITVVYDPYQLHDFAQRIQREHGIWFQRFTQGTMRNESDRQLFDLIVEKRVLHDGNRILRDHIENANRRRTNTSGRSFRIVKKANSLPIDGAVALSMASHECLRLNL